MTGNIQFRGLHERASGDSPSHLHLNWVTASWEAPPLEPLSATVTYYLGFFCSVVCSLTEASLPLTLPDVPCSCVGSDSNMELLSLSLHH